MAGLARCRVGAGWVAGEFFLFFLFGDPVPNNFSENQPRHRKPLWRTIPPIEVGGYVKQAGRRPKWGGRYRVGRGRSWGAGEEDKNPGKDGEMAGGPGQF